MKFTVFSAMAACVIGACSAPALAQAANPRAMLETCSEAMAAVESGSADWVVDGIAPGGMFAEIKPSGSGSLEWVRDGQANAVHFTGSLKRTQKAETESIDMVFAPGKATTLDNDRKQFIERDPDARPHAKLTTARKLMLDFWIEDRPFAYELEHAAEITLIDPATAGGETCDVVEIKLVELTVTQKKASPRRSYNLIRVFIARSDNLPRRVESVNANEMLTIGETIELNNMQTGIMLTGEDVLHKLPAGWRVDSTLTGDLRTRQPESAGGPDETGGPSGQPGSQSSEPTTPRVSPRPTAAAYEFTTEDGRSIDNASQRNRVTVLYFWGSWCMPCREFSPLVSQIAANAAEAPIDVFGIAVRERNPATPKQIMTDGSYQHALVLGADALASTFRVRVYPTIVVIDKQGRVVKSVRPKPGKTPEETMTEVTNAVEIAASE